MQNNKNPGHWTGPIISIDDHKRKKTLAVMLSRPFLDQEMGTYPSNIPWIKIVDIEKNKSLLQDIVKHTKNC